MDDILIEKLDELIKVFEKSEEIKRIDELKKEIYTNETIKKDIDAFNKIKYNPYSSEVIEIRKRLLNHPKIKEYKNIENELLLLTLSINQKLNTLINKKGCNHENN